VLGDAEQDEGEHALRADVGRGLAQRLDRVLELARHRRDRDRVGDAFLHEQRGDQVGRLERGLAHERTHRRRAAEAARSVDGEGHQARKGSGLDQTRVITTTGIVRLAFVS